MSWGRVGWVAGWMLLVACGSTTSPSPLLDDDTGAEDTGADDTAGDTAADTAADTAGDDTADTPPDPALCPLPALDVHYPGLFPINPFDDWAAAPGCLVGPHDAIIILGCPSEDDGTPSDCQQGRVDLAVRFSQAGYGDRFIPTGGAVANAYVEAYALRDLLVGAGIPEDHVFPEPLAAHTDENIYYSSQIMVTQGWDSALVVSEPEHLLYAAVCDANCCVELGRLATFAYPLASGASEKAASYVLAPPADPVSEVECNHLELPTKLMCSNLDDRLACADDFQL
ncbi:MAG: YdcF family protein [Deltaproteobacteria bacterium]|nr:YdcF family protein [Deltaproteobacteria bacterium]